VAASESVHSRRLSRSLSHTAATRAGDTAEASAAEPAPCRRSSENNARASALRRSNHAAACPTAGASQRTRMGLMRVGIGRAAHAAVSPHAHTTLCTKSAARTKRYTYAAEVWALCIVQG
jgi:hypothetical protein